MKSELSLELSSIVTFAVLICNHCNKEAVDSRIPLITISKITGIFSGVHPSERKSSKIEP